MPKPRKRGETTNYLPFTSEPLLSPRRIIISEGVVARTARGGKGAPHTIQTDLVSELTLAESRCNVSSCVHTAPRSLRKMPSNSRLAPQGPPRSGLAKAKHGVEEEEERGGGNQRSHCPQIVG